MSNDGKIENKPSVRRETAGLALGFLGVLVFGGTLPATRIALGVFNPGFVTFGRATVAAAAAVLLLLVLKRRFPRQDAGALALIELLLVFGFPILSSIAMQTVPAAHGGVVLGILPLTTSLFAALISGERPSPLFWACGVVGAVLVVLFALRDEGMQLSQGDIWLLLSCLAASLGYVVSGKLSKKMPGWEVICWALVISAPFSIVGTWLSWRPEFVTATHAEIAAFFYLGLGSMLLGFFAWNIGLAMGGIAHVSQVQLLQTFVTIAISAVLLGEVVTGETLLFAFAVVAVVSVGRWARPTHGDRLRANDKPPA
ncbi:DMT family transporter [Mesorhizobium sp. VNQ89]|uniref:DMT family transporter n=1 Tax=Mesorhizobium quangtriensis TaxID=3157709 RepID=UPI0032B70870